ncbi:hypothetical protein ABZP36_032947, partial [Zizania latifolia]
QKPAKPSRRGSHFARSRRSRGKMGLKCAKQPKKLDVLILVALLLLCNRVANTRCSTLQENSVDQLVLLDFKKGISSDPKGALSNWNTSIHFCRWNGINCSIERPYRVRKLDLTNQSLAGQIISSIGNLTFLSTINLSHNSFTGPLPLIRNLQQLQIFSLYNNHLDGIIPNDAFTNCSGLTYLDLGENFLTGLIPTKMGFLPNLTHLFLDSNYLTGTIPPTLGNASSLVTIQLRNNKLQGNIPDELEQLSNLSWLFKGLIPHSLGNISGLQVIDLSFNNFTGEIPSSFGNLSNLTTLFLSNNMLEARKSQDWEFLHALRNCHSLKVLSIQNNRLRGVIPNSIGNLSINLTNLKLGGNNLSGIVPQSIGNLTSLINLVLQNNYFSGTIGEWVGNLKKLL